MQSNSNPDQANTSWRIAREGILNIGGTRAVLMQIAHPLVAAGVSEHSSYMHDPFGRALHTFLLGQMITFGSTSTVRQAARTINRLHTHVHGQLATDAGKYTQGTPYHARNPELLLWVHATLIDTVLQLYPLFVGPLSDQEQEQYYQESKQIAVLLGLASSAMPASVQDLRCYMHDMVYGDQLAATPQARQLAHKVLYPSNFGLWRPVLHLNLQLTCALLPPPVREIYGLQWDSQRQRVFDLSAQMMRTVIPRLPVQLRVLPVTRNLMREGTMS